MHGETIHQIVSSRLFVMVIPRTGVVPPSWGPLDYRQRLLTGAFLAAFPADAGWGNLRAGLFFHISAVQQ